MAKPAKKKAAVKRVTPKKPKISKKIVASQKKRASAKPVAKSGKASVKSTTRVKTSKLIRFTIPPTIGEQYTDPRRV